MKKLLLVGLLLSAPTFTPAFGMDWFKKSVYGFLYTTPMHQAVKNGYVEHLTALLEDPSSADQISMQDQDGNTPLHLALKQDPEKKETSFIINILLSHAKSGKSIGIDIQDSEGNTPLHLADQTNQTAIIKQLFNLDADPIIKNNTGKIALILHQAVKGTDMEYLEYLLGNPDIADQISMQDQDGNTPLHLVLKQNSTASYSIFHSLLRHSKLSRKNIGINIKNNAGETPLNLALHSPFKNYRLAIDLWKAGADINAEDSIDKKVSSFYVIMNDKDTREKVLDLLKNPIEVALFSKKPFRSFKLLPGQKRPETVIATLKPSDRADWIKIDMTQTYKDGFTTLYAIAAHFPKLLEALLVHQQTKYDINIKTNTGNTALHSAVLNNQPDSISVLLKYGSDATIQNNDGNTPLLLSAKEMSYAYRSGVKPHNSIGEKDTKPLFDHAVNGGDIAINAQNNEGNTALHFLANKILPLNSLKQLISLGADPTIKNKNGKTALDLALATLEDVKENIDHIWKSAELDATETVEILIEATKPKISMTSPEYKSNIAVMELDPKELSPLLEIYPDLPSESKSEPDNKQRPVIQYIKM